MPRQRARALVFGTARGHLWDKNCWNLPGTRRWTGFSICFADYVRRDDVGAGA